MPRKAKMIKDTSRPLDDAGVKSVDDIDIMRAIQSLPTYRFSGACSMIKHDDDESTFDRWLSAMGRVNDDESNAIYDGSRDAFFELCCKHELDRAYAIVDTVCSFIRLIDDATRWHMKEHAYSVAAESGECLLSAIIEHMESKDNG